MLFSVPSSSPHPLLEPGEDEDTVPVAALRGARVGELAVGMLETVSAPATPMRNLAVVCGKPTTAVGDTDFSLNDA
jgi:hypothetical protein